MTLSGQSFWFYAELIYRRAKAFDMKAILNLFKP